MPLSRRLRFDPDKGLEIILYVSNRIACKDLYWVLKAPYFADKYNLAGAARPVSGDTYTAMKDGPVPSGLYDLVKDVRDKRVKSPNYDKAQRVFRVECNRIIPHRDADLSFLSKTEIESLDRAITEIGPLSFDTLKRRSHDDAYESADPNGDMSLEAIVRTLPDAELILDAA
ncbi:MAG TPA: Panacea domain-containing protein [Pyrinomonadaceae bacterium]|nr:Panacea domain-containing protein [Pyrinomonadaceae bacterium]